MDKIAKTNRSEMKPFKLEDEEEHHASMTDLFKPKYLLATVCLAYFFRANFLLLRNNLISA